MSRLNAARQVLGSAEAKTGVQPVEKLQKPENPKKGLKAKPRSKGNRAEREIIDILQAHGYPARRNFMSGGYGGADVIGGPPGFSIEVKHQETTKIWEWIAQATEAAAPTETPTVVFRRNRSGWYACVPFEDLLGLIEEAQA